MHYNTSEKGRKAIQIRWKTEELRIKSNLSELDEIEKEVLKVRLCGYISGDGSLSVRKEKNGRKHHDIRFYPDHESLIAVFVNDFSKVYAKTPAVRKMKNHYHIHVSCKTACEDLLKMTEFGSLTWRLPNGLRSNQSKVEWLKALFDCEAYVSSKAIQMQSVNKIAIQQIKELLYSFGINSRLYEYKRKNKNWNINYILHIGKKEDRLKYLKQIGFNHVLKLNKLKDSTSI